MQVMMGTRPNSLYPDQGKERTYKTMTRLFASVTAVQFLAIQRLRIGFEVGPCWKDWGQNAELSRWRQQSKTVLNGDRCSMGMTRH